MREISVRDAARRLDVSEQRIRAMLKAGRLDGHKVGRSWIIDGELDPDRRRGRGRPLRASNAWALLALLSDDTPMWIDPTVRSRLRRRIRDRKSLIRGLRESEPRGQVYRWRVLPGDIAKLVSEFPLVLSGLSAGHSALDIVPVGQQLDVYADEIQISRIDHRFQPERETDRPNLLIRVPSHPWVLGHFDKAPVPVVAADLLDHEDPRVAGAAARLFEAEDAAIAYRRLANLA